jgi:hypothetical protein
MAQVVRTPVTLDELARLADARGVVRAVVDVYRRVMVVGLEPFEELDARLAADGSPMAHRCHVNIHPTRRDGNVVEPLVPRDNMSSIGLGVTHAVHALIAP